jgi:predicted nucleotidyltransferase component of viral defense system
MISKRDANWAAHDAGLDLHLVQQEMVLVYALDALARRGPLRGLALKGGTYLRLMVMGEDGRLSEDLDFTNLNLPNDPQKEFEAAFAEPHHGVRFAVRDPYRTLPGNWACTVEYSHAWDHGGFLLEIRYRERPFLAQVLQRPATRRWFRSLPFPVPDLPCLRIEEALAEKLRAVQERGTERDLYDLTLYARKGFDRDLVRLLTVAKLWNDHREFEASAILGRLTAGRREWRELERLVAHRTSRKWNEDIAAVARRFDFLRDLTSFERSLAADHRRHRLRDELTRRLRERADAVVSGA